MTALLDELSRGRLWLPLPDASPVTDGSAVLLPTVTYLGAEFVPAFTSAERLAGWPGKLGVPAPSPGEGERLSPGDGPFAARPHIVVPAAELARRMPPGVGIALNPAPRPASPSPPKESVTWPRPSWSRRVPRSGWAGHPPTRSRSSARSGRP